MMRRPPDTNAHASGSGSSSAAGAASVTGSGSAAALTPFATVEALVQRSTDLWARDLRSLFEHARDRFADVSWETDNSARIWAHKGRCKRVLAGGCARLSDPYLVFEVRTVRGGTFAQSASVHFHAAGLRERASHAACFLHSNAVHSHSAAVVYVRAPSRSSRLTCTKRALTLHRSIQGPILSQHQNPIFSLTDKPQPALGVSGLVAAVDHICAQYP